MNPLRTTVFASFVILALGAIFLGTLVISWLPILATGLPAWLAGR